MVIAVDIRGAEAYQHFIYEVFKRLTVQHPDHTFIFISDNEFDPSFIFSENVIDATNTPVRIVKKNLPRSNS